MPTKFQQRKTTMGARKTKKSSPKNEGEKSESTNGVTIKEEPASQAIATITANIAATSISVNKIDFTPIIEEEERTPEDTTGLVCS